jgi:predicted GNAT family acetyltransferase
MNAEVKENIKQNRFELPIVDGIFAAAYYRMDNGRVVLIHTEVPMEFSGKGIASRLARGTFELLRKSGRKATLKCSFMSQFFANHLEYADVMDG